MAQTDLYPILKAYAKKNNSPYVNIDAFIEFLERYSNQKAEEKPEWAVWARETGIKFWSNLAPLVEAEKCVLLSDTFEGRIYMPFYYADTLQEAYKSIDNNAGLPFFSEESLGIVLPADQALIVNVESGLGRFFENAVTDLLPVVKLIFPEPYSSALVLAPMIPRRLMEAAFLKIRYYLRAHGNKEYAEHKLAPQLHGKEKYLHEILDRIMTRPLDCLPAMESYADFVWLFWSYFCAFVKNDMKKKKELLTEDLAVVQAALIIEVCNGFYKERAIRLREQEIAFRDLENHLDKPPLYYTMDQIVNFVNNKGVSLLSFYSTGDLGKYIEKKTTEGKDNLLPEWFVLTGKNAERWFIKKDKFLPLCAKLLIDSRPLIKKAVTSRWVKLIRAFMTEPAMEKDAEFNKLLALYTEKTAPVLTSILHDQKLLWVYEELEHSHGIPEPSRIFNNGKLIPMNSLYVLNRKDLLSGAKILLPFWYSIPVLAIIINFFKNFGKKKKTKNEILDDNETEEEISGRDAVKDIYNAARNVADQLVPRGQTLEVYLTELENRWSRLLNKQARSDLIDDVKSLIRDTLRQSIRMHRRQKITKDGLSETASGLIDRTAALRDLGGKDSLHLYMVLYMVKLLLIYKP
jgi:hypothetical protein